MIFDKLWQLERQLARSNDAYKRKRKQLEMRKASLEEMQNAGEEANWTTNTIRHLIEGEKSSRLLSRADHLGLATPRYKINENDESDEDKAWEVGYTGIAYLSRAAQFDLRNQIRMEEKARRDDLEFWVKVIIVPVLSVVIGILGATAGLVAILHKK
jgi:hypothetical protein